MSKANERLYIRLPSQPEHPVHWLIWDHGQDALIASGLLAADQNPRLEPLREKAAQRQTTVFVASHQVSMRHLSMPSTAQRHLAQMVPYALEDELASDIEQLHFAWPAQAKSNDLAVAVVAHSQMKQWLDWLQQAGIRPQHLYPDIYMLPYQPGQWQAMRVANEGAPNGDDMVVRIGAQQGFTVEADMFELLAPQLVASALTDEHSVPSQITHFGELNWEAAPAPLTAADIEVPMSVMAQTQQSGFKGIDLLQGPYKKFSQTKQKKSSNKQWRPLAWAAAIVAVLGLSLQLTQLVILNAQQSQLTEAIADEYRQTFPNERRIVNVRSQLNQHLAQLQGQDSGTGLPAGLLPMLQQLQPAFAAHSELQLELLRYEQGELRMQVSGKDFQQLEAFRQAAEEEGVLRVSQGQVSNKDNQVSGAMTVTFAAQANAQMGAIGQRVGGAA